MAEPMLADGEPCDQFMVKRVLKRKWSSSSSVEWLGSEERVARTEALHGELHRLCLYFRELSDRSVAASGWRQGGCGLNLNSAVALLIEESNESLSKLVDEVYEKLRLYSGVTMALVKTSVLMIGQRLSYGVPNVHADLLEDDTDSCLWCWETRDLKLMPLSVRGALKIRRTGRKKIHERIIAVSEMLNTLEKSESHPISKHDLTKASQRLCKVLSEDDIRLLMGSMIQKSGANMAEKVVKREEKVLIKQLEERKREAMDKEKLDIEHQKEETRRKHLQEKELQRLQEEAEKDKRRCEKEEFEKRKLLKKQQDEVEKEQRRKEKEEAEKRKQLALQKQASIMERFLKRDAVKPTCQNYQSSPKDRTPDALKNKTRSLPEPVTELMDSYLQLKNMIHIEELWNSHLASWRSLGYHIRANGKHHWGIRQHPKTQLIKELQLTAGREHVDDEFNMEKLDDGFETQAVDKKSGHSPPNNALIDTQKRKQSWQLLQFDKSFRPAFYGIWPKKSKIVRPRNPFIKDPQLDYGIDSDEEWEEDDPGESLSDCDKDDEELDDGCLKHDEEDESEDEFFVPDGYLSENEGVSVDGDNSDPLTEQARSSSSQPELESEELVAMLRQQKYLHNMTEHALRKNQPLIISNLTHEKDPLLLAQDLNGTSKVEQMCLLALSMRAFPGDPPVEISLDDHLINDDQEPCSLESRGCRTPIKTMEAISEFDLPKIVSTIQSCPQGINKVVESLQQGFPSISKTQLKSKVREVSTFVDNRWQVKKDILDKLGLSSSPEKVESGRTKSIVTFFSKRCLPPLQNCVNSGETSPP